MSSPSKETVEPSSSGIAMDNGPSGDGEDSVAGSEGPRPPAKRRLSGSAATAAAPKTAAVIEISDTESDDSDICAVTTYQATADEVKRIRGAEYSSTSSSSSDYSSDSESPWEDDSIVVDDGRTATRPAQAQLFPRANRMEDPKLNTNFKSQELIDRLSNAWKDFKELKDDDVTLTSDPFRVCLLHNLLSNSDIINNIVDDMNTLDWSRKKMDLYEFHQTADLATLTWQRSIRGIYELLKTEVMSWVSSVTGLELSSVSASCSLYGPGDHLLVHDDLLADRRVAFILYLAPWSPSTAPSAAPSTPSTPSHNGGTHQVQKESTGWSSSMGGALELLAHDERGPTEVTRMILPDNNMMAFFKVGIDSYHQVSEVVSMEVPRLSINGWFHGREPPGEPSAAPLAAPLAAPPHVPPEVVKPHNEVVVLSSWISAAYMSPRARLQIQQHMERDSEACLHRLLLPERCQLLLEELARPDVPWEWAGPAHRRRYERLPAERATGAAAELLQLASSAAYCRLLADCTDLPLAGLYDLQLQRWTPGAFTLLPPRDHYQTARLEAVLYLGVTRALAGGATTYVAAEEAPPAHVPPALAPGAPPALDAAPPAHDAALVTVPPAHNALSLVYCDPGAASFTKYYSRINARPGDCFYILSCTYTE